MPEAQRTKNWFQFNKGINTEQSELTMTDGFSTDEANYELLVDGSRRRRKGLTQEAGGATMTVGTHEPWNSISQAFVWRNAGGDSSSHFIVHNIANKLHFTPDTDGGSASYHASTIDLLEVAVNATSMAGEPLDFTTGRGVLFISGKHIFPTAISYDPDADTFSAEVIEIQVRDYYGIKDDIPLDTRPASGLAGAATVSDLADIPDHYYNLLNRGWNASDIVWYENESTGTSSWPAKQQYWAKLYRRIDTDAGVELTDGKMERNIARIEAEIFAGSDAPQGSMILNVFDDTYGFKEVSLDATGTYTTINGGNFDIVQGTGADEGNWVVEVTDASHPFDVGDEVFWKQKPVMFYLGIPANIPIVPTDTSTVVFDDGANLWKFYMRDYNAEFGWEASTAIISNASYWGVDPVPRSGGVGPITVGPKAIEFHGGRLFYAGIENSGWSDYVFFSQVVRDENNYKRCHTDADPTSLEFNQPVPTDGGYLILPELGNVKKLLSLQSSLLLFTDQGVWEIKGKGTFFDPANYVVRKITEAECGSAMSPILIEDTCVYTSPKGIYAIAPNRYTRELEAQNISDNRIRSKWNKIGPSYEPYIQTVYDDSQKRLYFLQPGDANISVTMPGGSDDPYIGQFNVIWVYDLRIGAFYKYEFSAYVQSGAIIHGFCLTGQDSQDGKRKLKFVVQTAFNKCIICDFDDTGYEDHNGDTMDCYVLSAWDNIGDMCRRKQAPIITVFSKRTETGYTSSFGGYAPVNPSSTTMTAYWDWTDDSVTGKIGSSNEVYRHVRGFVPNGTTDVDGYPVVVTRNKVRGRGRVLQLKFEGADGYDSHILGYNIQYKVSRRK